MLHDSSLVLSFCGPQLTLQIDAVAVKKKTENPSEKNLEKMQLQAEERRDILQPTMNALVLYLQSNKVKE